MRLIPLLLSVTVATAAAASAGGLAFAQTATTTTTTDSKAATPPAATTDTKPATPDAKAPAAPDAKATGDQPAAADPSAPDTAGGDDISIGEIPDVQTEELTPDLAKKAVDGYELVHDKYQDSPLEDYQDLQEFVDKDPKGKQFETDIKGFGFNTVNEWNIAVTSVSVAYNNILDDQTADIKQQIEDLKKSTDMAEDMKQKNIKSLEASIPSENNTKIIQDLMKDKVYAEKLKLLETTEE